MRDSKDKFNSRVVKFSYLAVCSVLVLVGIANANGQNQTSKAKGQSFMQKKFSSRSTESIAACDSA
jgi:hypothetical protein